MRWVWLALLAVTLALAGAWLGPRLAADPGYVFIEAQGWVLETTLLFALGSALVLALLGVLVWRLLRGPGRWLRERAQRHGRDRLARGLLALIDGRLAEAETELGRAARHPDVRLPALLGAARAAQLRDADAERWLVAAADVDDAAGPMSLLRAMGTRDPARRLAWLAEGIEADDAPPEALRLAAEAALATGQPERALPFARRYAASREVADEVARVLEVAAVSACMRTAADGNELEAVWSGLSRKRRQDPQLLAAYVTRLAAHGDQRAAFKLAEGALRDHLDESLVAAYVEIGHLEPARALREAERWLESAPDHAGLLLGLVQLCVHEQLWGKATDFLRRVFVIENSARAWEMLGRLELAQAHPEAAARALLAAIDVRQGKLPELPQLAVSNVRELAAPPEEQRSRWGIPALKRLEKDDGPA